MSRVGEFLRTKVDGEHAHMSLDDEVQDRVITQAANFRKMMQYYDDSSHEETQNVEWAVASLSTTDKTTLKRFPPPRR